MIGKNHNFEFEDYDIWSIKIKPDFTVLASFCRYGNLEKCDNQNIHGSW